MRRRIAIACLAGLLCQGLSFGQTPAGNPGRIANEPPVAGSVVAPSTGGVIGDTPPVAGPVVAPSTLPPVPGPVDATPAATTSAGAVTSGGGSSLIPGLRVWVGAEYLMWFLTGSPVPVPLVTNGVLDNAFPGAQTQTGTQTLIGAGNYNENTYHGVRGRLGVDFGDTGFGVEAIGFTLGQENTNLSLPSAAASPSVLGLPFINAGRNTEAVLLLSVPDALKGQTDFAIRTNLSGAEANFGYAVSAGVVDWAFIGCRYLNLTEALSLSSQFTTLDASVSAFQGQILPAGVTGRISDQFATSNNFFGGQVGLVKRIIYGRTALDIRTAVALGDTRQRVRINGQSQVGLLSGNNFTSLATSEGGLFAQRSNIGTQTTHEFSVVPEVGASLYVRVLNNVMGFVGYNFIYWNNVVRPGEQIDRRVEVQQIPFSRSYSGNVTGLPAAFNKSSDITIHGLNAGLAIQF